MRVLFNVEALLAPPLTGVGHYARNILTGLTDPAAGLDVVMVARGHEARLPVPGEVPAAALALGPLGPMSPLRRMRRAVGAVPGVRRAYGMAYELRAAMLPPSVSGDVYHDPNHLLRPMRCPGVVTIHDLSVLHYPQFHPPERVRAMSGAMKDAARRATRIIADTDYIARDIVATLGVPAGRVRVVSLGVGAEFRPLGNAALPVLSLHGLRPGGYLLAVGTREPRKNLDRLLTAFLSLPEATRAAWPLILVGPPGWRADQLEQRLDAAERSGQVRRLGYLPDEHRAALYSGAACFAYPSLYEGFGLPPLEAAACGCPVLTSIDSPMHEVLGDAAVLCDPLEVDSIAAGLRRILGDEALASWALQAGPARAARFSWAASVAGTIGVYREAVD